MPLTGGEVVIQELDIIGSILESLKRGDLTEEELLRYFQSNSELLKSNIESAYVRYGKKSLPELVKDNFAGYFENKDLILSNIEEFSAAGDQVVEKVERAFVDIAELFLVPCIGLFASGGWAQELDEKHHICLALEFPHEHMGIILAHEIAHGLSEVNLSTILDGLYNEGYATYVSSVLYPGYDEQVYLFKDEEWYSGCLGWIDRNRDKILEDSVKPFQVLDEHHLFYFGSGNVSYPHIGYAIGYGYLNFLNGKHPIEELRTFGKQESKNQSEFREFILGGTQ